MSLLVRFCDKISGARPKPHVFMFNVHFTERSSDDIPMLRSCRRRVYLPFATVLWESQMMCF